MVENSKPLARPMKRTGGAVGAKRDWILGFVQESMRNESEHSVSIQADSISPVRLSQAH